MRIIPFVKRPLRYEYFNAALILIIVNAGIFFIYSMSPARMQSSLLRTFALIPVFVRTGSLWQLFTYMFLHGDMYHLFFNMLGLFFFGMHLERSMGSREFLLFYFVCGFTAGLFSFIVFWLSGSYMVVLIGASGAIYGVLLAFAAFFPRADIYVFGIIPVRAPVLVLIYAGMEIFSQVTGRRAGIAHLTHLAGFATAYIYLLVRFRINAFKIFFNR